MKMESGDFVMPGDFLSVSEQFLPGQGAYEDDGSVKSGKYLDIGVTSKTTNPIVVMVWYDGDNLLYSYKYIHLLFNKHNYNKIVTKNITNKFIRKWQIKMTLK